MWRRYTQIEINRLSQNDFVSYFDKCAHNPEKCRTEEIREIRHKQMKDHEWYVVCFKYTIDYFPDFWNCEGYSITKEIEEDMPFDCEYYIKDYITHVVKPSVRLNKKESDRYKLDWAEHYTVWEIYLKEDEYLWKECQGKIICTAWDWKEGDRVTFDFIGSEGMDTHIHLSIASSAIECAIERYGNRKIKTEVTTTIQSSMVISDSVLDQITKDVEKLRNTKNAFIVEEIERSVKYINTLKKLL